MTSVQTKKRALEPSQDNTEKKKARQKDFDNSIPDSPSTSTNLPKAHCLPAMFGHDNKAERKDTEIATKDNSNDVIDKSTVEKERSNQTTKASTEDLNYEVQYLQAKKKIKQLQHKVREHEIEHGELQPK